MSLTLSMWNFHSWLQNRNISHSFSIRNNEAAIRGIRLQGSSDPDIGYAQLTEVLHCSEYQCMLYYGENYIYFRFLTMYEALDELNYMLSVYYHWEQALKKLNLVRCEPHALLTLCYELMPYPILILKGGELLASTPRFQDAVQALQQKYEQSSLKTMLDFLPQDAVEDNLPAQEDPILTNSLLYNGKQILLGSLSISEQHVRVLALANGAPFSPGDIHLMRVLMEAIRCNLELWRQRISAVPLSFFLAGLQGDTSPTGMSSVLRQLHWEAQQQYTVFWIEKRNGADSILMDKLHHDCKKWFPSAFCLSYENAVLLICNLDIGQPPPSEATLTQLLPNERFVIGQSNIGADFSLLSQLMQQAQKTMQQARQKDVFFLAAQDIMLDYIHQALYDDTMLQSLVHPVIRILMRYDTAHASHLLDALRAYLDSGGNCNAAAKSLQLHRNTLVNRLERIQTLTGAVLEDPKEREALLLSLLVVHPPSCENSNGVPHLAV